MLLVCAVWILGGTDKWKQLIATDSHRRREVQKNNCHNLKGGSTSNVAELFWKYKVNEFAFMITVSHVTLTKQYRCSLIWP